MIGLWLVACGTPTERSRDGLELLVVDGEGPLILGLHGNGERPDRVFASLRAGFGGEARIVVPMGERRVRQGRSWFPIEGAVFATADLVAASERLATLIDERADGREVIVTGVSQGGMLSLVLALRHPEIVDLAVPVAATLPDELVVSAPGRAPPIRAFHGAADALFPAAGTRASIERLRALGWDATFVEVPEIVHGPASELLALRDAAIRGWLADRTDR